MEETLPPHLVTKSSVLMLQILFFGLSDECRGSHLLDRILLDVPALYLFLRFVPRLCGEVLDDIDALTTEEIESLCKDGLGILVRL